MRTRHAPRHAAVATLVVASLAVAVAVAAASAPPPGSPSQVKALVAASHTIKRLPANVTPSVLNAANDNAATAYPVVKEGCASLTQCVFGDTSSSRTLVLFGDSHAEMWLSSLIPYATSQKLRLVLLTTLGCPVANVLVWLSPSQGYYTACTGDRQKDVGLIVGLKPAIVVVAERTAHLKRSPSAYFTNTQWQAGLESTLKALKPSGAKLVMIGDNTVLDTPPPMCLAAYPSSVQRCSNPSPNPIRFDATHASAEKAAAGAEHVPFVNPVPWLCTTTCSTVIGNMIVYWDSYHVTNTYATYVSKVMGRAVAAAVG